LRGGIEAVRGARADGSSKITVVSSGGSTVLLIGGLEFDSDEPLEMVPLLMYPGLMGSPSRMILGDRGGQLPHPDGRCHASIVAW
jgi:hypothetical protein